MEKIWVLEEGVHEKPIYRGDCLKRGGLDSLQIQWEGGLARNRGGEGWYSHHQLQYYGKDVISWLSVKKMCGPFGTTLSFQPL